MKSVLISIKPKYCELIANGKKTVEVRKTKPKIDVPFKCYIYMTKDKPTFEQSAFSTDVSNGKVVGEFECDRIDEIGYSPEMHGQYVSNIKNLHEVSCVNFEEMFDYIADGFGYGWHISNLVIYDKPKDLSEFKHECNGICADSKKKIKCDRITVDGFSCNGLKPVTRPPQSYMRVEELGV